MKFGIVIFPGTWSERDCYYAISNIMGFKAEYVWHQEINLDNYDCIVLPGGFSYGDYLRAGAIARFSPIMDSVINFANEGRPVIGICNGFQILCESGLLPGVLMQNNHLQYRCQWTYLKTHNTATIFTTRCPVDKTLKIPISHYEGNYYADSETLAELEDKDRIAFRYATPDGEITGSANPNGALHNIAGILNKKGNVLGMMPHPERSCESILGSSDGNYIWESIVASF